MRISISIKLIAVTVAVLLFATVPVAMKSSEQFAKVSSQREDFTNLESASAKAKEIENNLNSMNDKIKSLSFSLMKKITDNNLEASKEFDYNFNKDTNIFSIEILKITGATNESLSRQIKNKNNNNLLFSEATLNQARIEQRISYQNITNRNIEIKTGVAAGRIPFFTIGLPLITGENGLITHIVIADVALSVLQKTFHEPSEREQSVIDAQGYLLAHKDEQKVIKKTNLLRLPFIEKSFAQKSPRYQTKYIDSQSGKKYFVAAVKTSYGVTVISQISEEIILEPAKAVQRKALYITGIAISVALFLIFLLSTTLTSPIEKLAEITHIISRGQFNVKARRWVTSNDEVGDLAVAFDQMTEGLQERDKVKSLFSKFHGSSVAEDLINNNIGVGGQKRDVVVFFSDIRGFTAFSESKSPEDVVEMLNEYFAVMVKIITQYNGVVDKFIGDAIMAVWGAPKDDPDDAKNALRACLEMRKALEGLNATRIAKGQIPITIGMGLHAGQAISGTIGSDERMEYTVIGNTVNTASRIEASTKAFGLDLLISDEVVGKIGDQFLISLAGAAEVKGRSDSLKMYKVKGYINKEGQEVIIETPYSSTEAEEDDKIKVMGAA
ncbi:MAG: adenylate/guanylate cyclase domain-containing protein [Pseudobdellovibrionaceae bacterium]